MQIELRPIDQIKEYEGNPRDNSEAVDPVAASIKEFGFKVPVIVDRDGVLIAGHTRLAAARKIGLKQVPVIQANDLTPDQVRAFRLADNKLHELSSWNYDLLPIEIAALEQAEFDLGLLGFDSEELHRRGVSILPPKPPQRRAPAQPRPVCRRQQHPLWRL